MTRTKDIYQEQKESEYLTEEQEIRDKHKELLYTEDKLITKRDE